MTKWLLTCGMEYLQPIYDYFHRKLLKRRFLMMDETAIQILKEDGRRAETKSYFWVIRTGEDGLNPIILYNYTPTRASENIKTFLKGIEPGFYFMADGYHRYNKLKDAKCCCCWIVTVQPCKLDLAVQCVLYCNKLFEYKRTYKKGSFHTNRLKNDAAKNRNLSLRAFCCG